MISTLAQLRFVRPLAAVGLVFVGLFFMLGMPFAAKHATAADAPTKAGRDASVRRSGPRTKK